MSFEAATKINPDSSIADTYAALGQQVGPGVNVEGSPIEREAMRYEGDSAPVIRIKNPGESIRFDGYDGPSEDDLKVSVTDKVRPADKEDGRPKSNLVEYSLGGARSGEVGVRRRTYDPETGEYVVATVTKLTGERGKRAAEILKGRIAREAGKALVAHNASLEIVE